MAPRNYRNNNPINIRRSQSDWAGQLSWNCMTDDQKREKEFVVFQDPEWGFRAAAKLLRNYKLMYGIDTIEGIIRRVAPPNENNTAAYIQDVSQRTNIPSTLVIDQTQRFVMEPLLKAITIHETGSWEPWWRDEDLSKGLDLAGI